MDIERSLWATPLYQDEATDQEREVNWALWDHQVLYAPFRALARKAVQEGRLPLWNPFIYMGAPLYAGCQTPFFVPMEAIHYVLPTGFASLLASVLTVLLAVMGTYLLGRVWGLPEEAAVTSALAFGFSGALVTRLGISMGFVIATLPLVLLATQRASTRAWPRDLAGLALATATALFSSHHQLAAVVLTSGGVLLVWNLLTEQKVTTRKAVLSLIAVVSGCMIAAVHWLPCFEYLKLSQAFAERLGRIQNEFWLPASGLAFLLSPRFFGMPPGDYHGQLTYPMSAFLSTSALTVPLVLLTIRGANWRDGRGFAVAWGGTCLVLTFGWFWTPRLMMGVPLFGGLRLYYWAAPAALCLSILLGFGVAKLDRGTSNERRGRTKVALGLAAFSAILFAPLGLLLLLGGDVEKASASLGRLLIGLKRTAGDNEILLGESGVIQRVRHLLEAPLGVWDLGLSAAIILVSAALLRFAAPRIRCGWILSTVIVVEGCFNWWDFHTIYGRAPQGHTPELAAVLARESSHNRTLNPEGAPPNIPGLFGIREFRGYDAIMPLTYCRYLSLIDPRSAGIYQSLEFNTLDHPLLDMAAVHTIWQKADRPVTDELDLQEVVGRYAVYKRPSALPRVRLGGATIAVESLEQMERTLASIQDPDVVVVQSPAPYSAPSGGGWVEIRQDDPERLEVEAQVDSPRWLVVADQWFPGWRCRVDGRDSQIYQVNLCMRGVLLPTGRHLVEMVYQPRSLQIGGVISVVGWLVLATSLAFGIREFPSPPVAVNLDISAARENTRCP